MAARTRYVVLVVLGVLGLSGGAYAMLAVAGPSLRPPSFTAAPQSPTVQTSASFRFAPRGLAPVHDGQADGVVLQCSFAHALFTACTSPVGFSQLRDGWHTFRVRVSDTRTGDVSRVRTYRWRVDRRAPSVRLVFPVNGGSYDEQGWDAGCADGAGVCGRASDPSGVRSVAVSIRHGATGKWWGGHSFDQTHALFITATGTKNWRYPLPVATIDGRYLVRVRATDKLGNTTRAGSHAHAAASVAASFAIVAPPTPHITEHPPDPSSSPGASVRFTDTEAGVTFTCRLDGGAWTVCSSPAGYSELGVGQHNFDVAAVDADANTSAVASYAWTIAPSVGTPFTVTGDAPGLLYPGTAAQSLAVTVHNPNNTPILVTSLSATLASTGLPAGCDSAWFQVAQSNVSNTTPITIPANGSVSLPAQGASAPSIQMIDSHTNQDACQTAHLTITYTGSAPS